MAYLQHMTASINPQAQALGKPPIQVRANIGTAPPVAAAQPHVEPPPYDAAMDPAWRGILDPNDHELRNALNAMTPETRQMLLVRLGRAVPPAVAAEPHGLPAPTPGA